MDATITRELVEELDHETPETSEGQQLAWIASVQVLEDLDVWKTVARMIAIAAMSAGVLIGAAAKSVTALVAGAVATFAMLMVLYFVLAVAIDLSGGSAEHFALTPRGVRCGTAPDVWRIPYGEVTRLDIAPHRRYVRVDGGPLNRPIGLYCTDENFAPVVATLRTRCRGTRIVDHS